MLENTTYSEYIHEYPVKLNIEENLLRSTSIMYLNYDYSEENYSSSLSEFVELSLNKILQPKEKCFLLLLSKEISDTQFNRIKPLFDSLLKSDEIVIQENYYKVKKDTIIKVAVIEILDANFFSNFLKKIIDKDNFVVGITDRECKIDLITESLSNCFNHSVIDSKQLNPRKEIFCLAKQNKFLKRLYLFQGGFDYGQFAFFSIIVN